MSTLMVPPALPIGSKQTVSSPSAKTPSPSKGEKGGSKGQVGRRHNVVGTSGKSQRAWADYTPTPWLDYTPTPWGASDAYGFGLNNEPPRPDLLPPPHMTQGLPLHPPPRVAAMAAAGGLDVNAAAAVSSNTTDDFGMVSTGETPPSLRVKNTFIHMIDQEDHDEAFGLPNKSKTMPDVFKNTHYSATALATSSEEKEDQGSENDGESPDSQLGALAGDLPSRGSEMHGTGKCRPCAWFWKPHGCHNKADCSYCHLCPESELKSRKKAKVQAMRMGALMPASKPCSSSKVSTGSSAAPARVLKLSPLI
eukprot:CAMPEP_0117460654 /NCGR_PEP_ID=MMETSP0784-20121206/2119_1 /TAXON_ID=39447 /ORGANISM="" /LENGTH=307 /DNA_ID=CAMNT_0005254333 /DNA_START=100 /DNA_END=1024 /DNA_ORIENTATION=-